MSKLKGFVAACALVLTVSALLAGVCTDSARAGGAGQLAFADAQHGWQTTLEGTRAILWRTVDGGANWTRLQSKPSANGVADGAGPGAGRLAFASPTVGIWFWYQPMGRAPGMLRTTNGGRSWKKCGAVDSGHNRASCLLTDAALASSKVGWACTQFSVTAGGSIAKTIDAGATWHVQKRITGPDSTGEFLQVSCPTARICYVLGAGNKLGGLWATADGGKHWTRRHLPSDETWTSIAFPTATTGWAVGSGGTVATTTDRGRTWRYADSGTGEDLSSMSFCNSHVGYAVGASGTVLRTTDSGATWVALSDPSEWGAYLSKVTCVDATHTWIMDIYGSTYVSADGGNTWSWNPLYLPSTDPGE